MTRWGLNYLLEEAGNSMDRDLFIAEYATDNVFDPLLNDSGPDLGTRARQLGDIWDIAHFSIKEIRQKAGLSRKELANRFCIPIRTLEGWELKPKDGSAQYVRLMIAELLGLLDVDIEEESISKCVRVPYKVLPEKDNNNALKMSAFANGHLVGSISGKDIEFDGSVWLEITSFCVRAEWRKLGIGRELLRNFLIAARGKSEAFNSLIVAKSQSRFVMDPPLLPENLYVVLDKLGFLFLEDDPIKSLYGCKMFHII